MLVTQYVVVVLLCSLPVSVEHISIIIPWMGMIETSGATMGSSFMIAMKRLNYNVPFSILPLRCDDQFSVTSQVPGFM